MVQTPTITIVGATGAVGREFIALLDERHQSPLARADVRLLASARSAGTKLACRGRSISVGALGADSFRGVTEFRRFTPWTPIFTWGLIA